MEVNALEYCWAVEHRATGPLPEPWYESRLCQRLFSCANRHNTRCAEQILKTIYNTKGEHSLAKLDRGEVKFVGGYVELGALFRPMYILPERIVETSESYCIFTVNYPCKQWDEPVLDTVPSYGHNVQGHSPDPNHQDVSRPFPQ